MDMNDHRPIRVLVSRPGQTVVFVYDEDARTWRREMSADQKTTGDQKGTREWHPKIGYAAGPISIGEDVYSDYEYSERLRRHSSGAANNVNRGKMAETVLGGFNLKEVEPRVWAEDRDKPQAG